jgi:regulator of replication initiation timing
MTQHTVEQGAVDAPEEPFVTRELIPEGSEMPENLQEMVERNIELRRDNRDLKARTDRNNAELERLDKVIIEQFAARRVQQQKMETGETMYIQKSVYASLVRDEDGEHDGAHKALRDNGLEWLVEDKVNSNSLSGWVASSGSRNRRYPKGCCPS